MERNTKAWVSYLTWVAGLIIFLTEKEDEFVRENAAQSMVLGLGMLVIGFILRMMGLFFFLFSWISSALWIAYVVIAIICIVEASKGKTLRIPIVSDIAAKFAKK